MAQRGTPAKIDLVELEKLCQMQATDEEIAAFFSVSGRTITRRKKSKKFARIMERGRAKGRLSVRRAQLKMLDAGNPAMGIWLGKQLLGQTEYGNQPFAIHTLAVVMSPKDSSLEHEPELPPLPAHTLASDVQPEPSKDDEEEEE